MAKPIKISVYREQNYYVDPKDKFKMARVGIELTGTVESGETPELAYSSLKQEADDIIATEIEKAAAVFVERAARLGVEAEEARDALGLS